MANLSSRAHSPPQIDYVLPFEPKHVLPLLADHFDVIYNLDKDKEACAVASLAQATLKKGFTLNRGRCWPADEAAVHKFTTGLFDDVSRANTKSYQEEIFEMCGFTFAGEEYLLPGVSGRHHWDIDQPRPLVGLNTGAGKRWTGRLMAPENWTALSRELKAEGFGVMLLGGEDERNRQIALQSEATYLGHYPLEDFVTLIDQCDLIATGVTMALHMALALQKKVVLLNNIFMEDFDLTLALLRHGYPNRVSFCYSQGQRSGSQSPRGCSSYRDKVFMETSAEELVKHHPKFVRAVKRKTKSAWWGDERTDVVVSWKKAYKEGRYDNEDAYR